MYFFGSYVDYIVQNRKGESSIKKDKMNNETEKGGRTLQTPIKTNEDIALSPPIKTASTPQRERNAGIDLLKTLAMFMVVVLHVLGQGGVLGAAHYPNPSHAMGWWLEIESFGAVNCFAIATGFLMVGRKIKYRKLLSLWLTVQFYNLLFYLLYLVHPIEGVTLLDVSNFFPVYSGEFWYFTAYFGLFLFIPFLNILLEKLTKKQTYTLLCTGFILFSLLFALLGTEPFGMVGGYSLWWLMYLYFVGASIAKHKLFRQTPPILALGIYVVCVALTFGVRMLLSYAAANDLGKWNDIIKLFGQPQINYNAPLVLVGAVFLVIFCLGLHIPKPMAKFLSKLQPHLFWVYIIHLHSYIWLGVILYRFSHFAKKPWYTLPLWVEGTALGIFAGCILLDVCRHFLFKLLHIDGIINRLFDGANRLYQKSKLKKAVDRFCE